MREIKFRAYDKVAKEMSLPFELFGEFLMMGAVHDWQLEIRETAHFKDSLLEMLNDLEVMQYTGLKDKNGKEIYHSDFIKSSNGDVMEVVWREDLASFALRKDGWMYDHYFGEGADANECEVIGNIYENQNLLLQ